MNNVFRFITSIIVSEGAGVIGAVFTTPAISDWYSTLNKPSFTPPNFIFGPVWTTLYFLMGIALYLLWQTQSPKKKSEKKRGIQLFFAQLGLNVIWSIVFFGAHSLIGGLIVIVLLWYLIFQTIKSFQKVNNISAYLLYPYLFWVSFATILNFSIVLLNR